MEGWGIWRVGRLGRLSYFRRHRLLLKNPRKSAESAKIRDSDNHTIPEESLPRSHGHTQLPILASVHIPKPH